MAGRHAMRPFFRLLIAVVFGFCAGGCAMPPPYGANGGYGAAPAFGGYAGQYAQPAQSEPLTAAQAAQLAADAMASEAGYAMATLQSDAERGDAEAQQYLGMFYQAEWQQTHMLPYLTGSVAWTRRAAKKGMPLAQYHLALAYMDGNGIKHSVRRAVYWMKWAAAQQDSDAQYTLGMWYLGETPGIAKNLSRFFKLFRAAAKQNNPVGEYCLASAYQNGSGTAANVLKAGYWMHRAAAAGVVGAHNALAATRVPGVSAAPRARANTSVAVAAADNIAAAAPQPQLRPLYVRPGLIGRFCVGAGVAPRWDEYVPPHTRVLLTPAALEHLCQSINRLPITLERAKNGGYTTFAGAVVAKNPEITMPFDRFSSAAPQKYDINALSYMMLQIHRFVSRKFYRYNIGDIVMLRSSGLAPLRSSRTPPYDNDEILMLKSIRLVGPKGFQDFQRASPNHPSALTTGAWVVVLLPQAPFAPDTTEKQFSRHLRWYSQHFETPFQGVAGLTGGLNLNWAADISPNSTNFPASEVYRSSSLLRREAMHWDEKSMPRKKLLRLAHDGNRIAQFESRMKTHPPSGAVPWVQTQPPLPTVRGMRRLRNQAQHSWMALYQLDTYAVLSRNWNESRIRPWMVTAARYYMGTLSDPRRTLNERVAPKNALWAEKWYQWANPSSPTPVAERRAYDGMHGRLKYGAETWHFWKLAQQALRPYIYVRGRPGGGRSAPLGYERGRKLRAYLNRLRGGGGRGLH